MMSVIILILLIGSSLLLFGSVRKVNIDITSVVAGFYTMLMIFIVEGVIPSIPARVREALANASILAFLPSFMLFFYVGYRFGNSLKLISIFVTFVASLSIGVAIAILTFIILSTISKYRGGELRRH